MIQIKADFLGTSLLILYFIAIKSIVDSSTEVLSTVYLFQKTLKTNLPLYRSRLIWLTPVNARFLYLILFPSKIMLSIFKTGTFPTGGSILLLFFKILGSLASNLLLYSSIFGFCGPKIRSFSYFLKSFIFKPSWKWKSNATFIGWQWKWEIVYCWEYLFFVNI